MSVKLGLLNNIAALSPAGFYQLRQIRPTIQ